MGKFHRYYYGRFPKEQLGMGLGTNVMAANLGAITGYTLSGVMITYFAGGRVFY